MGVGSTVQPPRLVVHTARKPSVVKSSLSRLRRQSSTLTHPLFAVKSSTSGIKASSRNKRVHFEDSRLLPNKSAISSGNASEISSTPSPSTDLTLTTIIYPIPSNQDLDDHQRSLLWWTKEERRDIQSRNQAMIQDYVQRHPLNVRRLQQVFQEECCHFPSPSKTLSVSVVVNGEGDDETPTMATSSSSSSSDDSDNDDDKAVDDAMDCDSFELKCQQRRRRRYRLHHPTSSLHALCNKRQQRRQYSDNLMNLPTCVRGLEYGIIPDAKSYRKVHLQRILDWQERLRTMKKPENHENDIDTTLSGHVVLEQQSSISSLRSRRLAQLLAVSDASGEDSNNGKPTEQSYSVVPGEYVHRHPPSHRRLSMMASSSTSSSSSSVRQCRPRMIPSSMW
jgi:hypothetical protein